MCCCKLRLNLCKVGTCTSDVVDLGIVAKVAGVHKMKIEFLETGFTIEKTFAIDEQIQFPTEALNENYTFVGQIYDPADKQIVIERQGVQYDCIEFTTQQQFTI